jgi:hypothetical protein
MWFSLVQDHLTSKKHAGLQISGSRIYAIDTNAWLDFLLFLSCTWKEERTSIIYLFIYFWMSIEFWAECQDFSSQQCFLPLIQTASFSFWAIDERKHCLWFYSWWALNKIFSDRDLYFITGWKWLQPQQSSMWTLFHGPVIYQVK